MKTQLSPKSLLLELEKPQNNKFLAEFTDVKFIRNNLIYSPGHDKNLVFIVKKGRLRLYLAVEDKDFTLAILKPGDIYVTHTRAHVQTLEDSTLMVMPTSKLHGYMASSHTLSRTIISILGEMLKQSFSIIDSLVFKDIKQRLTELLLYEANLNGHKNASGTTINLDLTNTQLATIVGSSRQTVSTIVNSMLKDGMLTKLDKNSYLITDIDLLRKSAHT